MATQMSVMAVIRASRPSFRDNKDMIVFSIHSFFESSGFVLLSCGSSALAPNAISSSSSSTDNVSILNWNDTEDAYAFIYLIPENNQKKLLVKCLAKGDKVLVDAVTEGAAETAHIEIMVSDYVGDGSSADYAAQYKDLGRLVESLNTDIMCKVCHSLPSTSREHRPIIDMYGRLEDLVELEHIDAAQIDAAQATPAEAAAAYAAYAANSENAVPHDRPTLEYHVSHPFTDYIRRLPVTRVYLPEEE